MNQQTQPWNQNQYQPQANATQPLSDQELAFDLLYQEKALMANIASEVLEASHQGMRQVMNDTFMQIGQDQLQIFLLPAKLFANLSPFKPGIRMSRMAISISPVFRICKASSPLFTTAATVSPSSSH